jgi:hypothetical protein
MSDANKSTAPASQYSNPWLQLLDASTKNLTNNLTKTITSDGFAGAYTQYFNGVRQWQSLTQSWSSNWLHAYGLPTREDVSRAGKQSYEAANRVDKLEAELLDALDKKVQDNRKLIEDIAALRKDIAHLETLIKSQKS